MRLELLGKMNTDGFDEEKVLGIGCHGGRCATEDFYLVELIGGEPQGFIGLAAIFLIQHMTGAVCCDGLGDDTHQATPLSSGKFDQIAGV